MGSKNRKGDIGDVVFFTIGIGIVVGVIFASITTTNSAALTVKIDDYPASVSLISEAVVNSPNCLLYTDGEIVRDVIDWDKIDSNKELCVRKGPYIWKAEVNDKEVGDVKTVGSICSSKPRETVKRVLIQREGEMHLGELKVKVDSKDFKISTEQPSKLSFKVVIMNTGTCTVKYDYDITIVDKNNERDSDFISNNEIDFFQIVSESINSGLGPGETAVIQGDVISTSSNVDSIDFSNHRLRVSINPEGLDYYKKVVYYKLD